MSASVTVMEPNSNTAPTGKSSKYRGFDLIACPITLDNEFSGFLFVGGSVHEELTSFGEETLLRKIREVAVAGGAGTDLEKGLRKIPKLSQEEIDHLCDLLEFGAKRFNGG